jgi:hypothetical protein
VDNFVDHADKYVFATTENGESGVSEAAMLGAFSSYTILQLYVRSFVQYKATRDLFLPG